MSTCTEPHTAYQADDEGKWTCPGCGADSGSFYVVESSNDDCDRVHKADEIECQLCGYGGSGTKVMNALAKRDLQKPCVACNGKGTVDHKKPDPMPPPKKNRIYLNVCACCKHQLGHSLNCTYLK